MQSGWRMMKVLIAGGAGYIGSTVASARGGLERG